MRAFAFGTTLDQLTRASFGVRSLDLASHLPQMKVKGDLRARDEYRTTQAVCGLHPPAGQEVEQSDGGYATSDQRHNQAR